MPSSTYAEPSRRLALAVSMFLALPGFSWAQFSKTPLHDAGELLVETSEYILYSHYKRACETHVPYPISIAVLVYKDPAAEMPDTEEYREFFVEELLPHLRRVCPGNININVEHYVEGHRVVSYEAEAQTSPDALAKGGLGESSFGQAYAVFDEAGDLELRLGGWRSLAAREHAMRQSRADSDARKEKRLAEAAAKREREKKYFQHQEFGRDVLVCNQGDIDIGIATLATERPASSSNNWWRYRSWKHVRKNNCAGVSAGNVYTNIVVALVDEDYRFGVVKYATPRPSSAIPQDAKVETICVTDRPITDSGQGLPTRYTPPCDPGFFPAPSSATSLIREWGDGDAQLKINVAPSASDHVLVAFSRSHRITW